MVRGLSSPTVQGSTATSRFRPNVFSSSDYSSVGTNMFVLVLNEINERGCARLRAFFFERSLEKKAALLYLRNVFFVQVSPR